jgi:tetratricopeptide (TPR) repeat protein
VLWLKSRPDKFGGQLKVNGLNRCARGGDYLCEAIPANPHLLLNGSTMRIPSVLLSSAFSCALFVAAAASTGAFAQSADDGATRQLSAAVPCKDDRKVDTDQMIAACTAVIDNKSSSAADRLNALLIRSTRYADKEQIEYAMADLDRAVAENGSNSLPFRQRAEAYRRVGKYDQALRDANEGIRLDPANADGFEWRGNIFNNTNRYERAIEDYDQAIKLDAGNAQAYSDRGVAYYFRGNYQKAIDDYSHAIKLDPDRPRTYSNRGAAYKKLGKLDLAMVDESEAISRDPTQAEFWDNRGLSHAEKQEYDLAISDYNEAIRLRPRANFYTDRGDSYNYTRDYDAALADYDAALRVNPNFVFALNNRGTVWHAKGDDKRALADYDAALRLDASLESAIVNRKKVVLALERKGGLMSVAATPSFDCATARRAVEKAICGDPDLSRLDRDIGVAYTRAFAMAKKQSSKAADAVRQDQRDFVSDRNASFGRADYAVRDAMEKRLQALQARLPKDG